MKPRIAKWRIDSDEERRLAHLADYSAEAKAEYVEFYKRNDPAYYEKGISMIDKVLATFCGDVSEERRREYQLDMIYSLHRFGCMYDEYFLLGFENLNTRGRDSFITDKLRYDYYSFFNQDEYFDIFDNKQKTYSIFKKFYGREVLFLSSKEDFDSFVEFRRIHSDFIVKPAAGSSGKGVFIEKSSEENDEAVFRKVIANGPVVIEELVKQVSELSRLHPQSLNTVRITTIKKANGEVIVFHPFMRCGVGSSVVDNAGSGGIFVPVDVKTGICTHMGGDELGRYYVYHPETKVVFPGFQIPCWDEAVRFVKVLANVMDSGGCYVGWDCALTENGWVMIEGNSCGHFIEQFFTKTGLKRELDEIVEQLKEK